MAESNKGTVRTYGEVSGIVPSSTIKLNLEVAYDRNRFKINERGEYVAHLEGNLRPITTALFRRSNPRVALLAGGVAAIGYGLYKMGYKAGPFYRGSIAFDITTEPDKERTVRRRLENGTFLKELQEEVKDIIEEHSDILGDLKDFTITSCKEILPNKEKEGYDEVKNVGIKDLPPVPQGVNIVQGVKEILPNKEKEGYEEVKKVGMKDLPPVPQGVDIVQVVGDSVIIQRRFNKRVELKDLLSRSQGVNIVQGVEVDVGGEVPLSTIRMNIETPGLSPWEFNESGIVDIYLEICKYAINAALSQQLRVLKTKEEASIGFTIEQLGYIAEESSKCCITFDITIDSDKESRVRDILESETFLQELMKEVYMLKENPWRLFDLLHFTGISCEETCPDTEKGIYIIQTAEGRTEALVQETRQLRMLMLSLKEKFDGKVETKQSSKDQEPDRTEGVFGVQETCPDTEKRIYISQTAEGKIKALVKETRQLRMLMISLNNKFDGKVETMQTSKDQEPDTKTAKSFDVQPTRAETAKVTGPDM